MAIGPTRGTTIGYDQETTYGVQGSPSYGEVRPENLQCSAITQYNLQQQPNRGHAHSYDRTDDPVAFRAPRPGGLTMDYWVRKNASDNTSPPLAEFFESAGCAVAAQTLTTTAGTPTTTAIDLTDDNGALGQGAIIELDDGTYEPCITAAYATQTITPGMALSAAPSASNDALYCVTVTPYTRVVPDAKSLIFRYNTRAQYNDDEDSSYVLYGCTLQSVGEISIAPNMPLKFPLTFDVGKCIPTENTIAAETFTDSETFVMLNDSFQYCIANASSSGGIARNVAHLIEAKINLGFTTEQIPGVGNTTGTSGVQNAIHVPGNPTITITAVYDKTRWSDLQGATDGSIQHKYIAFVQPASAVGGVAWGFFAPDCYLFGDPITVDMSGNYITTTATYIVTGNHYAQGVEGTAGTAPWYLVWGGNAS